MLTQRILLSAGVVLAAVGFSLRAEANDARQVAWNAGDTAVVTADAAKVMAGEEAIGQVARGQQFRVERVERGWLLATVSVDGQLQRGWISSNNSQRVATAARTVTPRFYSYQPDMRAGSGVQSRSSGSSSSGFNSPWRYQRTDPRKYR